MWRRPVPKPRQQVRRDEPDKEEANERRTGRAVEKQRQPEDEEQYEAEHEIRACEDDEHRAASHGLHQRPSRAASSAGSGRTGKSESAPDLGARPGRENTSGAVRELLEREAASDVMLLQRGRRTFTVTIASTHEPS